MAKRSSKSAAKTITKYNKKLAAAAGIFAAGSLVGASVDLSSAPAYFEVLKPSVTVVSDRDETPAETVPSVQPETVPAPAAPAVPKEETPSPVIPPAAEVTPEPAPVPSPAPEADPAVTPEPDTGMFPESVPELFPEASPVIPPELPAEPDPAPEPDWMEGIFVPAPEPSEDPAGVPDDWMDPEWNTAVPAPEPPAETPVSPGTSSMTEELAGMLENVAVFWAPSGGKIHLDPDCRSFGTVKYAGTLEEAQTVRTEGWCRWCAEHLDGTDNSVFYIKGNVCATTEQLIRSYTYDDYLNNIPADAFGG